MPPGHSFDVSVVIPLFNKGDYIKAAIESVVAQTWPAREIIVVDDGSTDGGSELVRGFADERIKIISQPNAGPSGARNRGVAEAACPWVAFLDADDIWLTDHLATLAAVAEAFPQAAVVGSDFALDTAPSPKSSAAAPDLVEFFSSAQPGFFCASSVAVLRSALESKGGFGAFWPGEDVDLWARLALDHAVAASPKTTALYRQETGGLMEQSRSRFGGKAELQPMFGTLDAALGNEKYGLRHAVIARYRDQWLAIFARQALVAGRPDVASAYLREMQPGSREGGVILQLLAKLPAPLVRLAMRGRSALRRIHR